MHAYSAQCMFIIIIIVSIAAIHAVNYMLLCMTLQRNKFQHLGMLMAISVVQDGSGFALLAPPVFQYICGMDIGRISILNEDIPDYEVKKFIEEVYIISYTYNCTVHARDKVQYSAQFCNYPLQQTSDICSTFREYCCGIVKWLPLFRLHTHVYRRSVYVRTIKSKNKKMLK